MLDDFFVRAMLAGVGVALVSGPLGCFIVWRRLAYFGDTLAHAALLGVAMSYFLQLNMTITVFAVCAAISIILIVLQRRVNLANDSLLGLMSHGSLALGLVVLAFMTSIRVDLLALLFGDILTVTKFDLALIYAGGLGVLLVLALIWRQLFAVTVDRQLAAAEGMKPELINLVFMLLVASVIAIAMKIVGVMLITALLIIPAAAARRFAPSPELMAVFASVIGVVSVVAGLNASLIYDTPSGPSIVIAAMAIFLGMLVVAKRN